MNKQLDTKASTATMLKCHSRMTADGAKDMPRCVGARAFPPHLKTRHVMAALSLPQR